MYQASDTTPLPGCGTRNADVAECLLICPGPPGDCAKMCQRAAAVGARQRGLPFYVPFRQAPLEDWATLSPDGAPANSSWRAFDVPPDEAFAPWTRATNPWSSEWRAPPLALLEPGPRPTWPAPVVAGAATALGGVAQCHRACEARGAVAWRTERDSTGAPGPAPPRWWQAPWAPPLVSPVPAAPPTLPWSLNSPFGPRSFLANHIPLHGQSVAFET
jgi:hypothetical protein